MKLFSPILTAALALQSNALVIGGQNMVVKKGSDGLQNIVSPSSIPLLQRDRFGTMQCWYLCFGRRPSVLSPTPFLSLAAADNYKRSHMTSTPSWSMESEL